MAALVVGKELMAAWKKPAFYFVRECVLKGLTPRTCEGSACRPAQVVYDLIAGLEQELARRDELAWDLAGAAREEYIATHFEPLQDRIQRYRSYLDCIQDYTWSEFGLPHDLELAAELVEALIRAHYLEEEALRFSHPGAAAPAATAEGADRPAAPAMPHHRRCKRECRKIARRQWERHPLLTIAEMLKDPEIIANSQRSDGRPYSERTVRDWIGCLCPHRRPGRRPGRL